MLALELEPLIAEKAKANQIRKSESVLQNSVKQKQLNTQKEIADIAGLSHSTIHEAKKVKESGKQCNCIYKGTVSRCFYSLAVYLVYVNVPQTGNALKRLTSGIESTCQLVADN